MRARIKSGASLVEEGEHGTASTSSFTRHGSGQSDFIRHGVNDDSARQRKERSVKSVETAVTGKVVSVGVEKNPAVDDKDGDKQFDTFQKFLNAPSESTPSVNTKKDTSAK